VTFAKPESSLGDPRDYIRWLLDIGLDDRPLVGGKGAKLGDLLRAGFRVPAGFVLTAAAYERFLYESGICTSLEAELARLDPVDTAAVRSASREARELIEGAELPGFVESAVHAAYAVLAGDVGGSEPPSVAVRSSTAGEDGDEESFAGQHDTYLGVRGAESVARHVKLCWASLYTSQAVAYRARIRAVRGRGAPASMGVVVQRMVDARVAGVMFTCSPISGDPSIIGINASWGLGIGVMNGEITPDEVWIDKVSTAVARRHTASKAMKFTPRNTDSGVHKREVPDELKRAACLTDEEALALAALGRRVEERYGSPQDIEWAIDGALPLPDNIFLLQSRPETVWQKRAATAPIMKPSVNRVYYVLGAMLGSTAPSEAATTPDAQPKGVP
jgi:pyruvate,water dikinase